VSGTYAQIIGKDLTDEFIVPILESFLNDPEAEVRSEACGKTAEVAKIAT
jgi:hypothetical protein